MATKERFLADLDHTSEEVTTWVVSSTGCHLWCGATNHGGYPIYFDQAANTCLYAHRVCYVHEFGPLPLGKQWHCHHVCRVRNCVNPNHLRLMHASKHSSISASQLVPRTHCRSGKHLWIPENLYATGKGDYFSCRLCRREWDTSPEHMAKCMAYRQTPHFKELKRRNNIRYNAKKKAAREQS